MLALAMTELLARGGERVGLIGGRPYSGRNATRRVAEILMGETGEESLPPPARLSRFSECLLFSDFLEPVAETSERLEEIAAQGVRGHLVQVLDPAEETLPYAGRTEFAASEGRDRVIAGRAETLRERYQERLKQHRTDLAAMTERLGWSFMVHHTDRPAEEVVLTLHNRLAGLERDYRYRAPRPWPAASAQRIERHDHHRLDRLPPALDPGGACRAARHLVAVALHAAKPARRGVPADAAAQGPQDHRGDAGA